MLFRSLYTGVGQEGGGEAGAGRVNGGLHDATEPGPVEGSSGVGNSASCPGRGGGGGGGEEVEADLENNVEFAVLDELEDFSENFLDPDYGNQGGFRSEVIIQQEQVDDEGLNYSYEVCEQRPPCRCGWSITSVSPQDHPYRHSVLLLFPSCSTSEHTQPLKARPYTIAMIREYPFVSPCLCLNNCK